MLVRKNYDPEKIDPSSEIFSLSFPPCILRGWIRPCSQRHPPPLHAAGGAGRAACGCWSPNAILPHPMQLVVRRRLGRVSYIIIILNKTLKTTGRSFR